MQIIEAGGDEELVFFPKVQIIAPIQITSD
jgi:hypothetical protein